MSCHATHNTQNVLINEHHVPYSNTYVFVCVCLPFSQLTGSISMKREKLSHNKLLLKKTLVFVSSQYPVHEIYFIYVLSFSY